MATSCKELTHWKRLWCWEGLGAGGEGDDRGWDGCMVSPTRWTWIWANSGSWWWTGRPGVLQFMGLQRVGHDWVTELNWTYIYYIKMGSEISWNSMLSYACICTKSPQSCPTLCDPMDCSPPGSSVCAILQAKILKWLVLSSSRGSSWPKSNLSFLHCRQILYADSTGKIHTQLYSFINSFVQFSSGQSLSHVGLVATHRNRCFSRTLLLFPWSSGCWQFDLWFLCLF